MLPHRQEKTAPERTCYCSAPAPQGGASPLHKAAANGGVDIAKLLVEKGANVNAKDEVKRACLIGTTVSPPPRWRQFTRTPFLYHRYPHVLSCNNKFASPGEQDGDTPLMYAASKGQLKMVGFLCESGADVNATNGVSARVDPFYAVCVDSRLRPTGR